MTTLEAVAGQTVPILLYLKNDGAAPTNTDGSALTMSGMSCVFVLTDYDGNAQTIAGTMSVENSTTWLVKYSPSAADLVVGSYRFRIKVTDGAGKIAYFPSSNWDSLVIRSA